MFVLCRESCQSSNLFVSFSCPQFFFLEKNSLRQGLLSYSIHASTPADLYLVLFSRSDTSPLRFFTSAINFYTNFLAILMDALRHCEAEALGGSLQHRVLRIDAAVLTGLMEYL